MKFTKLLIADHNDEYVKEMNGGTLSISHNKDVILHGAKGKLIAVGFFHSMETLNSNDPYDFAITVSAGSYKGKVLRQENWYIKI